jgi:hypothetical protein
MPDEVELTVDERPGEGTENELEQAAKTVKEWIDRQDEKSRTASERATEEAESFREQFDDPSNPNWQHIEEGGLPPGGLVVAVGADVALAAGGDQARANQQLDAQTQEVGQRVQNVAPATRRSCCQKFCRWALGTVATATGGFLVTMALQYLRAETSPTLAFIAAAPRDGTGAQTPPVPAMTEFWLRSFAPDPEGAFWDSIAAFVEADKPRSFPEQLMFMQYTLLLANARPTQFRWDSPMGKLRVAEQLASTIAGPGLSHAYRMLPTIRHGEKAQALPRAVSAELMSRALVSWWNNYA